MTDKIWMCDVDGVVAQFSEPLVASVGANIAMHEITRWDWFDLFTKEQKKEAFKILDTPEFWEKQPLVEGAEEGIQKIRSAGFEVIWCTSPWLSCKEWNFQRREWLKRHFDASPDQLLSGSRKNLIRGAAFIDDKLDNMDQWMSVAGNEACHGYLFDAPYNQDNGKHRRMFGWKEIDRVIAEVLEKR